MARLKLQLVRNSQVTSGRLPIFPVLGVLMSLILATQYTTQVYLLFELGLALGFAFYKITQRSSARGHFPNEYFAVKDAENASLS
jgi:hypothetical protein